MKKAIFLLCFLGTLFPANAQESMQSNRKYYCHPTQIECAEKMIFVHLNGVVYEVDTLKTDQGGIYISEESLRCTNCRRPIKPKNICECHR